MRKYIHTACLILALPCYGQFSEIWTNGDLFAIEQMASQCYSASVERCTAVGVTPDSPSWWDYIVGKNYAKLSSVKENIAAVRGYYVNSRTNALDLLKARNTAVWTNDAHFLSDCGLPTNAISETPYFSSQYPNVTGGWVHCWMMLTNLTQSEYRGWYSTNAIAWSGYNSIDFPSTNNWTYAVSDASANWVYEDTYVVYADPWTYLIDWRRIARVWFGHNYSDDYVLATALSENPSFGFTGMGTVERKATAYCMGSDASPYVAAMLSLPVEDVAYLFDAQGVSNIDTNWTEFASITTNVATAYPFNFAPYATSTNDPGIPPNSDADPRDDSKKYKFTGYSIVNERIINNWTYTTNGFKYR